MRECLLRELSHDECGFVIQLIILFKPQKRVLQAPSVALQDLLMTSVATIAVTPKMAV